MISALAPAKINLGLEVLGRRADGYHDIVTIMQTVSLFDRVSVAPSDRIDLAGTVVTSEVHENLLWKAAHRLQQELAVESGTRITLRKRIPVAAGLGGASADAATLLHLLPRIWEKPVPPDVRHSIACELGSDVPFLLTGGTALAIGRGERLSALPALTGIWFVIVVPPVSIARKTASLYGALAQADFSDGHRVHDAARAIEAHRQISPEAFGNAFQQPLMRMVPSLRDLRGLMMDCGAPFAALSGAGPAHYTFLPSLSEVHALAHRLRLALSPDVVVHVARPVAEGPFINASAEPEVPE